MTGQSGNVPARAREIPTLEDAFVEPGYRGVRLATSEVAVTVAIDRGADIRSIVHRRSGIEVLWQTAAVPAPALDTGGFEVNSAAEWTAHYRGGWQTILPNFGPACRYKGADLDMHGEAARIPWRIVGSGANTTAASLRVDADLTSLPLHVDRRMRLCDSVLTITESVTNRSDKPIDLMWGHHPVLGPPLVSEDCTVETSAATIEPDRAYDNPANDLRRSLAAPWPTVRGREGSTVDLSRMPGPGSGTSRVATLHDFGAEAWAAVTNPALGLGLGLAWDSQVFPHAAVWQETGGFTDPPWNGTAYALAIEPQSSYPGHGLPAVAATTATQMTLGGRESKTARLAAVMYEGGAGVAAIGLDGEVHR